MNATASKTALSKSAKSATQKVPSRHQTAKELTACSRRDDLIVEHLPLVTTIAAHVQKSLPVHIELDDLVHAGVMGLFDAATRYCADKKVPFRTYAKHRIRGAILDGLRQLDWASRDLRKRYRQMENVTRELTDQLHRDPTDTEVASAMGLSSRRWQSLMVDFRSLNAAAQLHRVESEGEYVPETPATPASGPDRVMARSEMRDRLTSAMKTLPERYQQVVQMYYGREMTMKEIGGVLGVNESRVSQIHKSALERMHAVLEDRGICSAAAF